MGEIKEPIGNFLLDNAEGIMGSDGMYYHYSVVCGLLKKYHEQELKKLPIHDVIGQSELLVFECKVCGKPYGDKLSLYEHYDEEHNKNQ